MKLVGCLQKVVFIHKKLTIVKYTVGYKQDPAVPVGQRGVAERR